MRFTFIGPVCSPQCIKFLGLCIQEISSSPAGRQKQHFQHQNGLCVLRPLVQCGSPVQLVLNLSLSHRPPAFDAAILFTASPRASCPSPTVVQSKKHGAHETEPQKLPSQSQMSNDLEGTVTALTKDAFMMSLVGINETACKTPAVDADCPVRLRQAPPQTKQVPEDMSI